MNFLKLWQMDNVLMEKKALNIDKSTWKLTKLGDLLEDISQRVDNPAQSGYERFVGLEHFVSGDIKIRNWGTTENLTSSTKAFKAGDILFARRNAYLRRASLVDFDGCCSGDAFVLRENHEKVVPGFIAFFFNSNAVWDFANENAAGTMSQRVKWRDLANYEFLLPPKDQQAQLAELLWAMDEVIEREREVLERLENMSQVFFENEITKAKGKNIPLAKVLIPKKQKSQVPHTIKKYIGLEHIKSGSFRCTEYGDSSEVLAQCNIINQGDLCYSKLRPYLDKAFISEFEAVSTTELLIYDTKRVSKEYVLNHFHSRPFIQYVTGKGFGTKMPRVSDKIIGEYEIKILDNEKGLLNKMTDFQVNVDKLSFAIERSRALQKSIINQIF